MRIMRSLNRRISWLMAEKSFEKPIIGPLAGLVGVVPVSRAMDNMKSAEGSVFLSDPAQNPCLLRGIGTRFDGPGFEVGGSIYLPPVQGESQKLDIAEIRGPQEIVLKMAPTLPTALQQLYLPNGTGFNLRLTWTRRKCTMLCFRGFIKMGVSASFRKVRVMTDQICFL
jgi:glycerol-3-phosphate O-acyltransferase/dihydroxyacetone phosphate acyltransferase